MTSRPTVLHSVLVIACVGIMSGPVFAQAISEVFAPVPALLAQAAEPGAAVSSPEAVPNAPPTKQDISLDTVWVLVAAVLVMFMQAGFSMLECGFSRAKNAGHTAMKNLFVFAIASITFWAVGFAVCFGAGNAIVGTSGWFLDVAGDKINEVFASLSYSSVSLGAKYMFQVVFCAVSLAIVWGGMAERTKLIVYLLFGTIFSAAIYPVVGHWIWGGGWLSGIGMQDFAGSTVVHLQGASAALAGTILLGPRIGKFTKDGKPTAILGHNIPMVIFGTIILWFGWFGFNPGSTLSAMNPEPGYFAYVALTTNLAAASGVLAGLFVAWIVIGNPDMTMAANGALAALVAITASCAFVDPGAAVVIGAVAGTIAVLGVLAVDRWSIDDPVGAISVGAGQVAGGRTARIALWGRISPAPGAVGRSAGLVRLCLCGVPAGLLYHQGDDRASGQSRGGTGGVGYERTRNLRLS